MLIHFGGALAGAEEESVLVPVGEHRQAATAGSVAPGEEGKGLASRRGPGCLASPLPAWSSSLRLELGASLGLALGSGHRALGRLPEQEGLPLGLFFGSVE